MRQIEEEEKELDRRKKATKKTREELAEAEKEGEELERRQGEGRRRNQQEERQERRRLLEEGALLQARVEIQRRQRDEEARSLALVQAENTQLKNRRRPSSSQHGRRPIKPENARFEPEPHLPSYEESEEATNRTEGPKSKQARARAKRRARANRDRTDSTYRPESRSRTPEQRHSQRSETGDLSSAKSSIFRAHHFSCNRLAGYKLVAKRRKTAIFRSPTGEADSRTQNAITYTSTKFCSPDSRQ